MAKKSKEEADSEAMVEAGVRTSAAEARAKAGQLRPNEDTIRETFPWVIARIEALEARVYALEK